MIVTLHSLKVPECKYHGMGTRKRAPRAVISGAPEFAKTQIRQLGGAQIRKPPVHWHQVTTSLTLPIFNKMRGKKNVYEKLGTENLRVSLEVIEQNKRFF